MVFTRLPPAAPRDRTKAAEDRTPPPPTLPLQPPQASPCLHLAHRQLESIFNDTIFRRNAPSRALAVRTVAHRSYRDSSCDTCESCGSHDSCDFCRAFRGLIHDEPAAAAAAASETRANSKRTGQGGRNYQSRGSAGIVASTAAHFQVSCSPDHRLLQKQQTTQFASCLILFC